MMRIVFSILICLFSLQTNAQLTPISLHGDNLPRQIIDPGSCNFISSKKDKSLSVGTSIYKFDFEMEGIATVNFDLSYSVDGVGHQVNLGLDESLVVHSTPGAHVFQFNYIGYNPIITDSIPIEDQHENSYKVTWGTPQILMRAEFCKPVIYLYPTSETEVSVEMDIKGTNLFLYPEYEDKWEFTARPNGDLKFGDDIYNYLFWEATPSEEFQLTEDLDGFLVAKNDVVSFLEEKLTLANFSSKEKADFITYWGPRLIQNDLNFIHFIFNDDGNKYAELNINPRPDNVYRIYMIWSAVAEPFDVQEQQIPSANRDGFNVLEWGGQEQEMDKVTQTLIN